jgi:hypothetical protein
MAEKIQSEGAVEQAARDTVLAVSRHADGSPAQSPGFQSVDPEATAAISEAQLREQAASAVDYLHRSKAVADAEGSSEPDAETKALKDAQEKAADAAAKKVEKLD